MRKALNLVVLGSIPTVGAWIADAHAWLGSLMSGCQELGKFGSTMYQVCQSARLLMRLQTMVVGGALSVSHAVCQRNRHVHARKCTSMSAPLRGSTWHPCSSGYDVSLTRRRSPVRSWQVYYCLSTGASGSTDSLCCLDDAATMCECARVVSGRHVYIQMVVDDSP